MSARSKHSTIDSVIVPYAGAVLALSSGVRHNESPIPVRALTRFWGSIHLLLIPGQSSWRWHLSSNHATCIYCSFFRVFALRMPSPACLRFPSFEPKHQRANHVPNLLRRRRCPVPAYRLCQCQLCRRVWGPGLRRCRLCPASPPWHFPPRPVSRRTNRHYLRH